MANTLIAILVIVLGVVLIVGAVMAVRAQSPRTRVLRGSATHDRVTTSPEPVDADSESTESIRQRLVQYERIVGELTGAAPRS